ncbi:hypothetical protein C8Q80DRAFT_1151997 [Daedaleopsis nitida]|nr:hypothetical protein C8Q80DRAFT_1151997 [Daedaleopsis nitida]
MGRASALGSMLTRTLRTSQTLVLVLVLALAGVLGDLLLDALVRCYTDRRQTLAEAVVLALVLHERFPAQAGLPAPTLGAQLELELVPGKPAEPELTRLRCGRKRGLHPRRATVPPAPPSAPPRVVLVLDLVQRQR